MMKQPRFHFTHGYLIPNHDCETRAQYFRSQRLALVAERERQKRITRLWLYAASAMVLVPQAFIVAASFLTVGG